MPFTNIKITSFTYSFNNGDQPPLHYMENFTILIKQSQFLFTKNWYFFLKLVNNYIYKEVTMKKKIITLSFVFWWAIMFPILNFSEVEIMNMENNNIEFKTLLCEILH